MPEIIIATRNGQVHSVEASSGTILMEAIRDAGIEESFALCGGACSCATCHIYVDAAFYDALPIMSDEENELLDGGLHRNDRSRLSCQIRITDNLAGMRFTIAESE